MKELIGPRGLGDGVLVRAVALEWLRRGEKVTVYTMWPDLFYDLPVTVKSQPERTGDEDIHHCIACLHCRLPDVVGLPMFQRVCHQAGLFDPVPFKMKWKVSDDKFLRSIRGAAGNTKILIYQPPKIANGSEQALYNPPEDAFRAWIKGKSDYFRIKIGHPSAAHEMPNLPCELNLYGQTTVRQVIDLFTVGDLFFSQICFVPTLAEAMGKPSVCMFTRRQQTAKAARVRGLTPEVFFNTSLPKAIYVD